MSVSIAITVDGTSYRMTRDGVEAFINGEWVQPDTDYDPTPIESAIFAALESLEKVAFADRRARIFRELDQRIDRAKDALADAKVELQDAIDEKTSLLNRLDLNVTPKVQS